jgi:hypothetical protein
MTGLEEEAPANSVPAAAVRRGGQVLFGMTRRKGHVGGESAGLEVKVANNWRGAFGTNSLE